MKYIYIRKILTHEKAFIFVNLKLSAISADVSVFDNAEATMNHQLFSSTETGTGTMGNKWA